MVWNRGVLRRSCTSIITVMPAVSTNSQAAIGQILGSTARVNSAVPRQNAPAPMQALTGPSHSDSATFSAINTPQ